MNIRQPTDAELGPVQAPGFEPIGGTTISDAFARLEMRTEQPPPLSSWRCEVFGSGPGGIVWRPREGLVPNAFHRFMQRLCFGCRWIRDR